jgi:hypothetical protein
VKKTDKLRRLNEIWRKGRQEEHSVGMQCNEGVVVLSFTPKQGSDPNQSLASRGPEALLELTSEVQIVIKLPNRKAGQISARFTAAECYKLLEGRVSKTFELSSQVFEFLANAVHERKHYPMPAAEIPGEGGKSMTAQGQTKKPGSHSNDRHR